MLDISTLHPKPKLGRAWLAAALTLGAALASAPAAIANTTNSANWAGYAVHRSGVSFRKVSATWTEPGAACVAGQPAYSAVWVGLGGYKTNSDALEQVGTEIDCSASGQTVSSAWYELVPTPSKGISLEVQPGDVMHAAVTAVGRHVVLTLENLTRHDTFRKSLQASNVDVSSADWIVEAPSECINGGTCQTLPLANFGSVAFDSVTAVSAHGIAGPIIDPHWGRTKIKLTNIGPRFIVFHTPLSAAGVATPSALESGGAAFDVTYSTAPENPSQSFTTRSLSLRAAYIRH